MVSIKISEITWPEYDSLIREVPVILPIGATEQHGHHLPLGTDAIQVAAIADGGAAKAADNILVAPVLNYGYKSSPRTGGGEAFPGTISLDAKTCIDNVRDVLRQLIADGAKRIVTLSGHYENTMPMLEGIDLALRDGSLDDVTIISLLWTDLIPESSLAKIYPGEWPGIELEHAAWFETSIMMHLRPDLVHVDRAGTEVASFPPYDVHPQRPGFVPPTGSLTRSTGASPDHGKQMVDEVTDGLADLLATAW